MLTATVKRAKLITTHSNLVPLDPRLICYLYPVPLLLIGFNSFCVFQQVRLAIHDELQLTLS